MYTMPGRAEPALYHAERCLAYCESDPDALEDWDLPYAYEALARAHLLAGNEEDTRTFAGQARKLGARVADHEDREHLEEDLATLP